MSARFVDRKAPQVMTALDQAPIYKKQGSVKARPAISGEEIVTQLADGHQETKNVAQAGDWIVTNPDGEQYIIKEQEFLGRYEATDEDGVYAAKGYCRAVTNPFRGPITIMASWGELQNGDEQFIFADVCDASGKRDGEPYLIDAAAFASTYKRVETAVAQ